MQIETFLYFHHAMIDFLVYAIFASCFFILLYKDTEARFCALFLGTLLFPSCIWIIDSPKLSPQHILLYTYFLIEITKDYNFFIESIKKFPFKIPILLVIISFICTVYTNNKFDAKEYYVLARYVIELYGYLLASFIIGRKIDVIKTLRQLFPFMFILGVLGIFEGLFNANYPFKYICSAFPYYDGFYDLSSSINASDAWRTRTLLTTTYPTAYGTLLCGIVLVFFPMLKKLDISLRWKIAFVLIYLANLFLSGSRTGMLCSAIALAFWFTRKWHILIKLFMIFALIVTAYFSIQQVIENFSQETRGSSLQLRQQQLIFSVIQIAEKPLFGNGVGFLTKYIFETDAYGDRIKNEDILGMESILFPKLINYGFVGLFLYFTLSIWIFIYFFKRRDESEMAISGAMEIFAMTLFFVLSGNMGNASAYTYLIIGLLTGGILSSEEAEQEKEIAQESQMISLEQDVRGE